MKIIIHFFVALCVFCTSVEAITITVGRSQSDAILSNVSSDPFSGVGVVGGGCSGSAIAPTVVITAAHCFSRNLQTTNFFVPFSDTANVQINGRARLFPGYNPSVGPFDQKNVPDLAVVELFSALPNFVQKYNIASFVTDPVGSAISLVGYGRTGDGNTGEISGSNSSTIKRFGQNIVDQVQSNGNFFDADFDGGGQNRLGGGSVGELESATARGDSGGPAIYNPAQATAFALSNGDLPPGTSVKLTPDINYILGVTSYGTAYNGANFSSYGTTSSWTYVAPHIDWISSFSNQINVAGVLPVVAKANVPVTFSDGVDWTDPPTVPLPSASLLIVSGLLGLSFIKKKRQT